MSPISFEVIEVRAEPHAAVPTLMFRLRLTASSPEPVHAIALRCQIMIEPQRRRYDASEEERLTDLFGETPRWGDTLRPFLWTNVSVTVTGFSGATDVDLPVACSYDMEVAASRYFHGLGAGEIPVVLLFSGTVFSAAAPSTNGNGLSVSPIAWHEEASHRLPVATWRTMMEQYFPNSGWLRLHDETIDALRAFRAGRGLLTWEETFAVLLKEAGAAP